MIYQTGSATDANDLLSIIRTAITSNGWVEDEYVAEGTGYRLTVHNANGAYFTLRSAVDEEPFSYTYYFSSPPGYDLIAVTGHTAWDSGVAFDMQPGHPKASDGSKTTSRYAYMDGPVPNYFLFMQNNPDAVYLVVEWSTGLFSYLAFGEVEKYGTWTGGPFFMGISGPYYGGDAYFSNSSIFIPMDPSGSLLRCNSLVYFNDAGLGLSDVWAGPYNTQTTEATLLIETRPFCIRGCTTGISNSQYIPTFRAGSASYLPYYNTYNWGTGETYFIPSYLWATHGQSGFSTAREVHRLIGVLPNFWHVNMRGLSPKQVLTFGAEEYMVFPVWEKPDPFDNSLSTNYRYGQGFVIRRN